MNAPIPEADHFLCPKCRGVMVPTPGTMAFRGRWFLGLVCTPCNSLWDNPNDSMIEYAKSVSTHISSLHTKERQ